MAQMTQTRIFLAALIIMTLSVLITANSAFAYEMNTSSNLVNSDFTDIYITNVRYNPYPAEPGSYVIAWFKVENRGDNPAAHLTFTLKPQYPFSIDGSENATRDIGKLLSRESAVLRYKIRVDSNAVEGEDFLHYEYRTTSNGKIKTGVVPIRVQTLDAILAVNDVVTTPSIVKPGNKADIEIKLQNAADSELKQVTLKLNLYTQATTTSGIATSEIPFTPINSGSEKTIYNMKAGEERSVKFSLTPNPDAEPKPYKIPITITYYDNLGRNYTREEIVGIVVGAEPELSVLVDDSELLSSKSVGTVRLKFINRGLGNIKFLRAILNPQEDYTVTSSKELYIGGVDSDDYQIGDYKLYVSQQNAKSIRLPLHIEYQDANNNHYEKDFNVEVPIFSEDELGIKKNNSALTIILVIVIIVALFIIYRRWEKKRNAE